MGAGALVKILTGRLRGQTILFKANAHLRPTTDKARKAIFDMLQGVVEKKRVLDLFSGTGALGFEALSQGASHVTFVEQDAFQCKKIMKNLKRWKFEGSVEVCHREALRWLSRVDDQKKPFDFVFFDPPYETDLAVKTLNAISTSRLAPDGGFVVLECRRKYDVPSTTGNLKVVREKRYGQTKVMVYKAFHSVSDIGNSG